MVFFQAIGKPIQAMFLTVARQGVIYIPLLFVLKNSMQLNGIVLAQPISDFITMIITITLYMSFIMKKKKEKENVVEAVS
jgi:Na+-driven multidrug efflux pump